MVVDAVRMVAARAALSTPAADDDGLDMMMLCCFLIGSEVLKYVVMGVHVDNLRCETEGSKRAEITSEAKSDADDA